MEKIENTEPVDHTIEDIIDPEIPTTAEERRELLNRCLAIIAQGGSVQGVDPRHVSSEGMQMIKRAKGSQVRRSEL